jgi:hypothetical protein
MLNLSDMDWTLSTKNRNSKGTRLALKSPNAQDGRAGSMEQIGGERLTRPYDRRRGGHQATERIFRACLEEL